MTTKEENLKQSIKCLQDDNKQLSKQNEELRDLLERERHDRDGGSVELLVVHEGGGKIGNCYHSNSHKVMSMHRLTDEQLLTMHRMGVIGSGQEFYVRSKEEKGTNRWCEGPHYYHCESRTDSSD